MVVVTIEIRNKLEEYKKGLDALLTKSRLWTSDTEEEKIRIRTDTTSELERRVGVGEWTSKIFSIGS